MCEAALAYSTVTADTGGLLCEAGAFHGKLQRPQSHAQRRHCRYMPLSSPSFLSIGFKRMARLGEQSVAMCKCNKLMLL